MLGGNTGDLLANFRAGELQILLGDFHPVDRGHHLALRQGAAARKQCDASGGK
ncbi:MAG: hypothetical protein ACE5FM_03990 [Methyloligellaceae bacterium]